MNILGISAYYHDSAACLVRDGEIIAAAQEERFTRKKHDARFPRQAIQYCLSEAGIGVAHLDIVTFYDKPFVKFERLLETYIANTPKGFRSFLSAMPVWLKEKLYLKSLLKKELTQVGGCEKIDYPRYYLQNIISPTRLPQKNLLSVSYRHFFRIYNFWIINTWLHRP